MISMVALIMSVFYIISIRITITNVTVMTMHLDACLILLTRILSVLITIAIGIASMTATVVISIASMLPVIIQGFSYGPLVWAPNLAPNIYLLYTIFKTGAYRRDPTRIKGAQTKGS